MKEIVKRVFAKAGLKLERMGNIHPVEPRYEKLISEHYNCYRDVVDGFDLLPDMDKQTNVLLSRLDGTQVSEAFYILHGLAMTKTLPGDVCEFGVAQGFTSALIAHTIVKSEKSLWLFDSFEGLPAPTEKDVLKDDIFNLNDIKAYAGTMAHKQEVLISNLGRIELPNDRIRIVPGFIEKTIKSGPLPESVAFAYVDFDFYEPIKIALGFLKDQLVPNGIVVVDDYDFFSEGAKTAVDEFIAEQSDNFSLELPIKSAGKFAIIKKIQK